MDVNIFYGAGAWGSDDELLGTLHYEKKLTKSCFTSLIWYSLTKYLEDLIDIY